MAGVCVGRVRQPRDLRAAVHRRGEAGGERTRISTNGGSQPRFRADGQELFYLADDGRLMAVSFAARGDTLQASEPKALFKTRTLPRSEQVQWDYDVTGDGQRFVIGTILEGPHALPTPPTIILNWPAALQKQFGLGLASRVSHERA